MAALVHITLLVMTVVSIVEAVEECPPWFEWVNISDSSGYCACSSNVPIFVYCEERSQKSSISQASCTFYDSQIIRGSWCSFLFQDDAIKDGIFPLPSNVSELNSVVCGNLSREVKGPLCGRCTNNTGPSVYHVGSRCVPCRPVNVLYYLLLQYLPSTIIFILIIIFRPNIASAPMANYVLFCNYTAFLYRAFLLLYFQPDFINTLLVKFVLTLSALWSFYFLIFVSPPLCISQHMKEFFTPFLEFLATIYPFVLLWLVYMCINLHTRNFKPVVVVWRLVRRLYVQCYRAWDPTSSMIQAFASLFYLSHAKLMYIVWEAFVWTKDVSDTEKTTKSINLFMDPNVPYRSIKHACLITFSLAVAVFVFLPPLLILVVYPTSLYTKISHWISPKWRLRIKTYVEICQSCFKDGTNGTRDYRSFSGLNVLCFVLGPQIIMVITGIVVSDVTTAYSLAVVIGIEAFVWSLLQPYKERVSNVLTTGLLINGSMVLATAAHVYDNRKNKNYKTILIILIFIPHCVFWCYIIWRVIKILIQYSCKHPTIFKRNGLLEERRDYLTFQINCS